MCERPPRRFAPPLLYQEGTFAHRHFFRAFPAPHALGYILSRLRRSRYAAI